MKTTLSKAIHERVAAITDGVARRAAGETVLTHVPTGLRSFDDRFGGLEIGILTLIVGHTGDGKTTFLAHLAKSAAQAGLGVLLVLLEDPMDKLADRVLAAITGESANKIARLQVSPERLQAAAEHVDWSTRIGVVSGNYSPDDVLGILQATTLIGGAPLGLVVVDYAQGFLDDEEGMEKMCARMARSLNAVAMERRLAAVFGSQVKSEVLARGRSRWERTTGRDEHGPGDIGGFRPGKGDVMWSRRLEQYAKAVWYLFRPGRWERELGNAAAKDNVIEVNVGKANFSQEGSATFGWDGATSTVFDKN